MSSSKSTLSSVRRAARAVVCGSVSSVSGRWISNCAGLQMPKQHDQHACAPADGGFGLDNLLLTTSSSEAKFRKLSASAVFESARCR